MLQFRSTYGAKENNMPQERGRFITVEGIDGAGKSTQLKVIAEAIRSRGIELVMTREPGGTPTAEKIREILLHEPMSAKSEMLLMFAARQENLEQVIRPALAQGKWVLCDRFTDASYAYQAYGRQYPVEWVRKLEAFIHPDLKPDRTVLFDLDVNIAAKRLQRQLDRFEMENISFHDRVRNGYLQLAKEEPRRFLVVDSSMPPEAIRELLKKEFSVWR